MLTALATMFEAEVNASMEELTGSGIGRMFISGVSVAGEGEVVE